MNIPGWQPMSELPEDDDQAIQVKLEFEGRERISVLTFAAEWRTREILKVAEGYHEVAPFKATAWRPMNEDLWRCAPNTPEAILAQEAGAAERYKNSAEYKLARLEDLRRWRPMSDIEAAKRANCVLAERLPKEEGICRVHIATVHRDRWLLIGSGDVIHKGFYADWQWTYIPGQEPKEEV